MTYQEVYKAMTKMAGPEKIPQVIVESKNPKRTSADPTKFEKRIKSKTGLLFGAKPLVEYAKRPGGWGGTPERKLMKGTRGLTNALLDYQALRASAPLAAAMPQKGGKDLNDNLWSLATELRPDLDEWLH